MKASPQPSSWSPKLAPNSSSSSTSSSSPLSLLPSSLALVSLSLPGSAGAAGVQASAEATRREAHWQMALLLGAIGLQSIAPSAHEPFSLQNSHASAVGLGQSGSSTPQPQSQPSSVP